MICGTVRLLIFYMSVRDEIASGKLRFNLTEAEKLVEEQAYEARKRIVMFASDPTGW